MTKNCLQCCLGRVVNTMDYYPIALWAHRFESYRQRCPDYDVKLIKKRPCSLVSYNIPLVMERSHVQIMARAIVVEMTLNFPKDFFHGAIGSAQDCYFHMKNWERKSWGWWFKPIWKSKIFLKRDIKYFIWYLS